MKNNKSGFTLTEIIVVLIIIGILACISSNAIFQWIEKSKACEAFQELGYLKDKLSLCLDNQIGCDNLGNEETQYWNYIFTPQALASEIKSRITATTKTNSGQIIFMRRLDKQYDCEGTNIFKGMCSKGPAITV